MRKFECKYGSVLIEKNSQDQWENCSISKINGKIDLLCTH